MVEPKVKFANVPAQMILTNMLISPNQPTLEDAKEILNRVRVDRASHIFAFAVVHYIMALKETIGALVATEMIGHNHCVLSYLLLHNGLKSLGGHAGHMERPYFTAAFNQGKDFLFMRVTPSGRSAPLLFVAPERFVYFNGGTTSA
jgi:hypothetical protein